MGRLPLPPFTKLMRWARGQAIEVKDATEAWGAAEAENTEAENPEAENPEAEKKRYRSRATRGKYLELNPPTLPRRVLRRVRIGLVFAGASDSNQSMQLIATLAHS